LQTWNGRDSNKDLLEELADALQYAVQDRLERIDIETAFNNLIVAAGECCDDNYAAKLLTSEISQMKTLRDLIKAFTGEH
jgi:hypothetical protein